MAEPVAHIDDLKGFPMAPEGGSERFGCTVSPVGAALGLTGLGLMVTTVQPGMRAFPFHNHLGNDEAFVILEGEGTYRFGETDYAVRAGSITGRLYCISISPSGASAAQRPHPVHATRQVSSAVSRLRGHIFLVVLLQTHTAVNGASFMEGLQSVLRKQDGSRLVEIFK